MEGTNESKKEDKFKTKLKEWISILSTVSVEPAAVCMMTANLMTYLIFQNIHLYNICRVSRNNSAEVCTEIVNVNATFHDEEQEIQKLFATQKTYRSFLDYSFPILCVLILGPMSDHFGRKTPLLITTLGVVANSLVTLLIAFYYDTWDPLLVNLLSAAPRMITGGEVAFASLAFSYICDQTDHKIRTIRTGMLNAGYQIGIPIGFFLAGLGTRLGLGYKWTLVASAVIALISVLIVVFTVKDKGKIGKESFCSIINPKNNLYSVAILPFKKRSEKYLRPKIWILLVAFIFCAAPIHGEFTVMYLFLRERVGWDIVKYGDFSSYNSIVGVAGVALSMGILSKWLKLRDPVVGFISGLSQLAGCLVYIAATSSFMMYVASSVDLLNGTMSVIVRSMLSKLVQGDEVGKLFSLMAIMETLIPLAVNPLYTGIYIKTVDSFVPAVMLLSAVLTLPPQLIYLFFIWKNPNKIRDATELNVL